MPASTAISAAILLRADNLSTSPWLIYNAEQRRRDHHLPTDGL